MKTEDTERALERLLAALEQELIDAPDEEVLEAAADLGMNPLLKGSSAFFGVTVPIHPSLPAAFDDRPGTPAPWWRGKSDLPPTD